jgi:hypothetical protein
LTQVESSSAFGECGSGGRYVGHRFASLPRYQHMEPVSRR